MSIRSLAARGRLSFAHLTGFSAKADSDLEDDDKKDARAEGDSDDEEENTGRNRDDGDAKKGKAKSKAKAKAEDEDDEDDQGDDGQKSGKKAKAEDGDETKDYASEDDDDDQGDDGQKSGKRAKAEEDEDDEDEEMRGKSVAARARRREQARCAAIFGCKAAARNPEMAANLAFNTRMPRQEAIAVLRSAPAAVQPGSGRQARNPNLGAGGEMHRNPAAAASAGWDRSFAKITGKRG
jgi:hypothetical protein